MVTIFGDVQYSQVMGHLPTPVMFTTCRTWDPHPTCYVSPPDGPDPSHAVPPGPHQASQRAIHMALGKASKTARDLGMMWDERYIDR